MAAKPPTDGPGDWYTSFDIQIQVVLPQGSRRVHPPHLTEIREKAASYVEALLTGRDKPYTVEKVSSSSTYGYMFDA